MNARDWRALLKDVPDDIEVVIEEVYGRSVGLDEYDDYEGMGTGEFTPVSGTYNEAAGRIEITKYAWPHARSSSPYPTGPPDDVLASDSGARAHPNLRRARCRA